jgi:hypothetical protein
MPIRPPALATPQAAGRVVHDAVELGAQPAGGIRVVAKDRGGVAAPQELDGLAMTHAPAPLAHLPKRCSAAPGAGWPIQPKIKARQLATTLTSWERATLALTKG